MTPTDQANIETVKRKEKKKKETKQKMHKACSHQSSHLSTCFLVHKMHFPALNTNCDWENSTATAKHTTDKMLNATIGVFEMRFADPPRCGDCAVANVCSCKCPNAHRSCPCTVLLGTRSQPQRSTSGFLLFCFFFFSFVFACCVVFSDGKRREDVCLFVFLHSTVGILHICDVRFCHWALRFALTTLRMNCLVAVLVFATVCVCVLCSWMLLCHVVLSNLC